jgi:hypothetical protein
MSCLTEVSFTKTIHFRVFSLTVFCNLILYYIEKYGFIRVCPFAVSYGTFLDIGIMSDSIETPT